MSPKPEENEAKLCALARQIAKERDSKRKDNLIASFCQLNQGKARVIAGVGMAIFSPLVGKGSGAADPLGSCVPDATPEDLNLLRGLLIKFKTEYRLPEDAELFAWFMLETSLAGIPQGWAVERVPDESRLPEKLQWALGCCLGETPEAPFRIRREEAEPHAKVFAGLLGDQKKLRSENEAREKRPERILELLRKTRFPAVGWSEWFLEFLEGLEQKAKSNEPVLIAGPAGTGRKTAALAVHALSGKAAQPALVYAGEEDAVKILRLAFERSKSGSVVIADIEKAQEPFLVELGRRLDAKGQETRLIVTTGFERPDLLERLGQLPADILPRIGNGATEHV